MKVNNNNYDLR